ncbi:MAG: hypothetical protein FWE72_01105 [Spirochaetaceae bacterium]|nr:hypothetical protein [Spirochaetaceae bacterium]
MESFAEKGILTLAIGKKYNKMAKYLAYSCILHSPTLPRAIITDDCEYFKELYDVTIQYSADMGDPFNVKLKLQHYSPFFETLFLDSDTLVYTDLRFMYEYFGSQSIVYTGTCLKEGKWYFKEISNVLKDYNIPWVGKLNSGIFLFRKDETGMNVMNYAAELRENHRGLDIPFVGKNWLPDEPFLAIAFGKYGQLPKTDFGRLGRSFIGKTKKIKLDITKGISSFIKSGESVFPAVVHFTGDRKGYYFKEKMKLLIYYKGIPGGGIGIYYCPIHIVSKILSFLKFIRRCIKYILKRLA